MGKHVVGNVVEEYKIGNTTIKICDDAYAKKTQEDIDEILRRITEIARRGLAKQKEA